jgi:uncharacterized protein (TIGR00369 family)
MSEAGLTLEQLQERITRGPFNHWLNFTVTKVDDDGIEVKSAWREEWVVNPDRRYTHGGILSAIIDVAADYAIAAKLGRPVPTIDLRVDFHKAAMPGDLIESARRAARQPVFDRGGVALRPGRGAGGEWAGTCSRPPRP